MNERLNGLLVSLIGVLTAESVGKYVGTLLFLYRCVGRCLIKLINNLIIHLLKNKMKRLFSHNSGVILCTVYKLFLRKTVQELYLKITYSRDTGGCDTSKCWVITSF